MDNFLYDISHIKEILNLACSGGSYQDLSAAMADYAPKKLSPVTGASGDRKMNFYKNARTEFSGSLRKFAKDFYGYSDEILCETLKESASLLADLSVFLRAFENRFAKEKRRRRIVTFADMERFALSLLWDKENDAPSELALSLRGSFDEIYIDDKESMLVIKAKQSELNTREYITLQSKYTSADGNQVTVGTFVVCVNVRGNYISDIQLVLSETPNFDNANDIYGNGAILNAEARVNALYLTSEVNTL